MMQISQNISLLPHNTFGIDVQADYFAEYQSEAELMDFLPSDLAKQNQLLQIGEGSNLLFLSDFKGVVLHSKICFIEKTNETENEIFLQVGAGVKWDDFVAYCVENQLFGAENLSLIPGEVGAAAVQNIGAYGAEVKDLIEEVETVDIQTNRKKVFSNSECCYAYRESVFKTTLKGTQIVTAVTFRLSKKPVFNLQYAHLESEILHQFGEINLANIRKAIIATREEKLPNPNIVGNAGSFFRNPYICIAHYEGLKKQYSAIPHYPVNEEVVKVPAAWLIEQCGWKGKSLDKAAVHTKQPLVLINNGNATGNGILHLAQSIQQSVKQQFSIDLQPEVEFVG
jgi:UDP-N-acetylmuramate dehydrogenase